MRIFLPGEPDQPQQSTPCCLCKLGKRIGVFDPLSHRAFGMRIEKPMDTAPLWNFLESLPWETPILVLSDDPTFKTAIMSNLGRLGQVYNYMEDDEAKPGVPYELFVPMAAAIQAVGMIGAFNQISEAIKKKAEEAGRVRAPFGPIDGTLPKATLSPLEAGRNYDPGE